MTAGCEHADFRKQLKDYRLTTADILYRLPDHPAVLQQFIWQELDIAPLFPVLKKFLHYWDTHLEGRLYRVKVAHQALVSPGEFRYCEGELILQ